MEEADEVGVGRLVEVLRLKPSFAPTFFQPLLCAAIARWSPPGDEFPQSADVGGVVGGVMGSMAGGELPSLSSVNPSESKA